MTSRAEMRNTIGAMLDGRMQAEEAKQFLLAQPLDYLTAEALAGGVDAVMERAVPFPAFPSALDCCGTGGDGRGTYNISTAAAFVAAARGVMIAKHGNRAITSKSGSADVLDALGVNTGLNAKATAEVLHKVGICFLFAPMFHPGFAHVAPVRKTIPQRTIFNILGPLCNPAKVQRQLIGVFTHELTELVAETCKLLGREEVMVVCGQDGTDELSISDNTYISHLKEGAISHSVLRPQDVGITPSPGRTLIGGDAVQNANALRAVLAGEENPYADAVKLNAAALFVLAGKAPSLEDGVVVAQSTIARGLALKKLDELIEVTNA